MCYGSINFLGIFCVDHYFHRGRLKGSFYTAKAQRADDSRERLYKIVDNLRVLIGEDTDRDLIYD